MGIDDRVAEIISNEKHLALDSLAYAVVDAKNLLDSSVGRLDRAIEWYEDLVTEYIPESTGIALTFLPIMVGNEVLLSDLSDTKSLILRGFSMMLNYLTVPLIMHGRKKINDHMDLNNSSKKSKTKAEGGYSAIISIFMRSASMLLVTRNPLKIAAA